jgi:DNA segregation ATPase FtsK/SpoIIIE, S-DNA-T family
MANQKKNLEPSKPSSDVVDSTLSLLTRFQRFGSDILGIVLLAACLMTLISFLLPQYTGGILLGTWGRFLRLWLGWGALLIAGGLGIAGLFILKVHSDSVKLNKGSSEDILAQIPWKRIFVLEAAAFAGLTLLTITGGTPAERLLRAESGMDGGRIGWGLAELLRILSAPIGLGNDLWQVIIPGTILILGTMYGLGLGSRLARALQKWMVSAQEIEAEGEPAVSFAPVGDQDSAVLPIAGSKRKQASLPAEFRKRLHIQPIEQKPSQPPPRAGHLPPLELLIDEQAFRPDERNINQTAGLIEKTLAEFGIPAKVIGFRVGPTVTQFAVEPGFTEKVVSEEDAIKQKVRVSQISSLRRDLALALSAERLRIEAPVPGRPYIGVEVPNPRASVVRLRPILESETFYKSGSPLTIALGRDVSGQPVVADLLNMPHLLIAGTTGSGKSVCIAALTTCLVMNNTPEDLRLVMIDPKMVELVRFNGLPHLYGKVETDIQRILGVLRWTMIEMDRRYKLLEEMNARHLDSYNRKVRRRKGGETLPRIVLMIDELADLMMTAPDQTEHTLIRLAQMARATGIHLVVATQRPSTDVVTGLIKANFPARISFAVASSVDSRVILDSAGAESLLGHGDMLFLPPEALSPIRSQGVMVSDQEVEKVITFWQKSLPKVSGEAEAEAPWEPTLAEDELLADKDNLIVKAIEFVRESQRASTSLLQRKLRIGYPRAARLMDELEEMGVVGPSLGGGREREVLIQPDDEISSLIDEH